MEQFREVMREAGLDFAGPILPDGRLHRFKAADDHERNSWYVLHDGPPAAGVFGCWKRQIKTTWHDRNTNKLTGSEREELRRKMDEADKVRQGEEVSRQDKARKIASWILSRSKTANGDHPYLVKKGVRPHGELREYRGALVLPLRDADGVLHSMQFIGMDGSKRFLTGGRVEECYFTVNDRADGPLVLCEGYATGASVHEATGHDIACAMHCGNLLLVAKALRGKWPKREIIIAADDDRFTDGNPGLTKATEAARAICARLAIPQFKSTENKPTDFNDLHASQSLAEVKAQIDAATSLPETDAEAFARLAELSGAEYDRVREAEAKRLRIRVATLDSEVHTARGGSTADAQGHAVELPDIEPWPEAVDGAATLDEIAKGIAGYVVLPDGAADALALWIAHTHCFDAFLCTPRLNITSPDKGCGKSVLCDVLAGLVPRALPAENLTAAVLFRITEAHKPTILADEYDAWIHDNEELRGMFNAGHRRGGQALRCEGEKNDVRAFHVFAPALLAGIGNLPGTLHDRSIVVRLVRAKSGEVKTHFDPRHTEHERELCRKVARWCADHRAEIESCDPTLPAGAFNRLADNWRPLFAIAVLAGRDWSERARHAFALLTASADQDAQGIGAMLLADIRQVFNETHTTRLFSKALVEKLIALTDRPWSEIRGRLEKSITENWLAQRLKPFGIAPKTLRIGEHRAKGYELQGFQEAFERYLADTPLTSRDTVTTLGSTGSGSTPQAVTSDSAVTATELGESPANIDLSRCHAPPTPVAESATDELII